MKRFSETKYYVAYSETEALKMTPEKLQTALWIDFDDGRVEIDESIWIVRGRIRTSSNYRGLVQWRRGKYEIHHYLVIRPLGQIKRIVFAADKKRKSPPTPAKD